MQLSIIRQFLHSYENLFPIIILDIKSKVDTRVEKGSKIGMKQ